MDIDIGVEPSQENAERVRSALAAFGAPLEALGTHREDFTRLPGRDKDRADVKGLDGKG